MRKRRFYLSTAAISLMLAAYAVFQISADARAENDSIGLTLNVPKSEYALGEVVEIAFELRNYTHKTLEIAKPSVFSGNLRLFISTDGETYKEYCGPDWGMLDARRQAVELKPSEAIETAATVAYNNPMPTDHLTPLYANPIRRSQIDSEYAIAEAGMHWFKAVYRNGKLTTESEPVRVKISEPTGNEQALWEQMKTDGSFALFMQTGNTKNYPGSSEEEEFMQRLERITAEHPGTEVSRLIGERFIKHRAAQENLEKIKRNRQKFEDQ